MGFATVLTCAISTTLFGQQATATVQLPIVRTIGVATTVSVPDNGYGLIESNKRVSGHAAGRARMRQGEGDAFCVGVTIHRIEEVEQRNAWRVAYRLFETGRVGEAIDRFNDLVKQEESQTAREAAKRELAALREIGLAAFDRAVALAQSGDTVEGSKLIDKILTDFDQLINSPQRRAIQKQLRQSPELAETRDGTQARELLDKGIRAKEKGRLIVAKQFFQQSARYRGTKAAEQATDELLAMGERVPTHRIGNRQLATGKTPTNQAGTSNQTTLADQARFANQSATLLASSPGQRWLDLARLYRDIDPTRAKSYYSKALSELPPDTPNYAAIKSEADWKPPAS